MPPAVTLQPLKELCCQADGLEAQASAKIDLQEMKNVCHVHRITVESIQNGWAHENFATQCDEYTDLEGAKECLSRDYHVQNLTDSLRQMRLML